MTKATFGATVGLIGAFVAKSLGGWDAALITLVTGIKAGLNDYRQKLRDITKQKGFPKEVVWPEVK